MNFKAVFLLLLASYLLLAAFVVQQVEAIRDVSKLQATDARTKAGSKAHEAWDQVKSSSGQSKEVKAAHFNADMKAYVAAAHDQDHTTRQVAMARMKDVADVQEGGGTSKMDFSSLFQGNNFSNALAALGEFFKKYCPALNGTGTGTGTGTTNTGLATSGAGNDMMSSPGDN